MQGGRPKLLLVLHAHTMRKPARAEDFPLFVPVLMIEKDAPCGASLERMTGVEPAYAAWEAVELTFSLHLITVANP